MAVALASLLWASSSALIFGAGALVGSFRPQSAKPFDDWALAIYRSVGRGSGCRDASDPVNCGFNETAERTPASCDPYTRPHPRHAVLLTFGQSNSANFGQTLHVAGAGVDNFNVRDGACYRAEDPLLGPDGEGGSVWSRLGDRLVEGGHFDRVLIAAFGAGGSEIALWAPEGSLHPKIAAAAARMQALGIRPTHVLWHQGEAERAKGTRPKEYVERFRGIVEALRTSGIDAPVYPAIATICRSGANLEIRAAQRSLPDLMPGVRLGPDTDSLDRMSQRHDNCHFSDAGLDAHARLWVEAMTGKRTAASEGER